MAASARSAYRHYAPSMRVRLGTALLAAALVTSACSDDEPAAGPTLPPITEVPSASSTADAVPSEATAATPQGAAEFARHFYAQVERAYVEKEPRYIRELSAPGCSACERFVASVTQLRDENQRSEGATYEIVAAEAPAVEGESARVDVVYNGPEAVVYDVDNNVVLREPAVTLANEQLNLVRVAGEWRVQEVIAA